MYNSLFKSTLVVGVLFSSTTVSWAECPNTTIECVNGTKQKVNTKWSWRTARCEPMKSGGGNSLDVAISACETNGGGIKKDSLKDGISVKMVAERAAKIGFIVGKAVFDVAMEQQKAKDSQPAGSSPSYTSIGSSIISKVPNVIKDIGNSQSNKSTSSAIPGYSTPSPTPTSTSDSGNAQQNTSTSPSAPSYSPSSPTLTSTSDSGNAQQNTSTSPSASSYSPSSPTPTSTSDSGNAQQNTSTSPSASIDSTPSPLSTSTDGTGSSQANTSPSSSTLNSQDSANKPTRISRKRRRAPIYREPSSGASSAPVNSNYATEVN